MAIALPGSIADRAWNQSGYEGVELAQKKNGVKTAVVERVAQSDRAEILTDFARKNYHIVFAHGGQFDAAIQQVAPQSPNTFFVAVNGAIQGENIAALRAKSPTKYNRSKNYLEPCKESGRDMRCVKK